MGQVPVLFTGHRYLRFKYHKTRKVLKGAAAEGWRRSVGADRVKI